MVEDEWNADAICKQIVEKNGCMIKGEQCDCESTTANKFFSISMEENEKLPVYDYARFDVIVFDEIYCNDFSIYHRINKFIKDYINSKIIIATGDTNPLSPIKPFSNTKPFEEYANACIKNYV